MHDRIDADHQIRDQRLIGNVPLDEMQRRIGRDRRKVRLITGISQLVQHHHLSTGQCEFSTLKHPAHERRPDETGTAGDQQPHPHTLHSAR
jgi:hypothetical protein